MDRRLIHAYVNAGHDRCTIETVHGDSTCDHYLPHDCQDRDEIPPEVA